MGLDMKEIRSTSSLPLKVPLPGGKTLHLGPRNVAQVADNAVDHPGLKKLIRQKESISNRKRLFLVF